MIENQIKTVILLGALTGVLIWIGSFWGRGGMLFALIFAMVMNLGSYWFSDKIVLKMYKGKEIQEKDNKELFRMVRHIAGLAKLPMPKVYIVPSEQPNAFATGRNPKHAAVAFTAGILRLMSKKELEGITAHELAHVKNRDTLITAIASTIAGVISYVAFMARWGAIFGGMGRNGEGGANLLELLAIAIITPLIATIIQLSISRSREFIADESGARYLRTSEGLSRALQKLEEYSKRIPMKFGTKATSSMFIINPFSGKSMLKLLSTHPSTEERIKKLRAIRF